MHPPELLLEVVISATLDAPRQARDEVRGIGRLGEATSTRLVALVSELVSALIEHDYHQDLVVRVLRGEAVFRVEAFCDGAFDANPDARALSALSRRWGVRRRDPVVVWAEIRAD